MPLPASVAPFHTSETSPDATPATTKSFVTTGCARSTTTFTGVDQLLLLPTMSIARMENE